MGINDHADLRLGLTPPLSEGNSIVSEAYVIAHLYVNCLRSTVVESVNM